MTIELSSELVGRARVYAALGDPVRLAIVEALVWDDASPGQVAHAMGLGTNLVAHHLQVLQDAGVVERTRSEGDRRRTYVRLRPEILAGLAPPRLDPVTRVVFVCTHNSARSQFAAALWYGRSLVPVASAGTRPAARVHPRALKVGRRHGLSLAEARPTALAEVVRPDDLVIAVCDQAHEQLTGIAGRRLHWSVPDPARANTDAAFERAFADITGRVERFAPTLHAMKGKR